MGVVEGLLPSILHIRTEQGRIKQNSIEQQALHHAYRMIILQNILGQDIKGQ